MLGKLLKYEISDTAKTFTPFYGIVLVLTVLASFSLKLSNSGANELTELVVGLIVTATVLSFTVVLCMVWFFIISRFYTNLVKTEGYFMHSLPVSPHSLIISKIVSSTILVLITAVFTILCAFLFVLIFGEFPIEDFLEALKLVITEFLLTFTFAVGVIDSITTIYASIALGSLFSNKFLGSVISYVGYTLARSFVASIINITTNLTTSIYDYSAFDSFESFSLDELFFSSNMMAVVFCIISYIITYYIFSQKLNLE